MPDNQINFPNDKNVNDYSKMIEDLGGADKLENRIEKGATFSMI
jgi:hypothetical protein